MTSILLTGPSVRPSFGLSDWVSPHEPDAWAAWRVRVDAGRIGDNGGGRAANAAADAMARIVLGRPARAVRFGAAAGPSTSGGAGTVFHLDVASRSSTSGSVQGE